MTVRVDTARAGTTGRADTAGAVMTVRVDGERA